MSGVPAPVDGNLRQPGAPRSLALVYVKGIAMGLGDSVPGVSGGTIAVITKVYERLIHALRALDSGAGRLLLQGRLAALWRHVDGSFLAVLALGILSGLLLSANTVLFLLDNHFEPLMAFFIGLVLVSALLLRHEVDFRNWRNVLAIGTGLVVVALVSVLNPVAPEMSLPYVFASGLIAISAMILPGLSGAFLLLLLGAYEPMLTALVQLNLPVVLVFMAGCVTGLMVFSRVLAWLLRSHRQISYGFISGVLVGSVILLWPWQRAVTTWTDGHGVEQALHSALVWPLDYAAATGNDPRLVAALLSFSVGAGSVVWLQWIFGGKRLAQT